MRAKGSLEQDIMLGQVAGYRRQGKPQIRYDLTASRKPPAYVWMF